MARSAEGDCTRRHANRCYKGLKYLCRNRPICCNSGGHPNSLELSVIELSEPRALEKSIESLATYSNSGLLVTANGFGANHPEVIPKLAARYKLPAVYPFRYFIDAGGLVSYGPNLINDFRQAADYVDRILRGEKPAELPVQAPTKYELVINLKTAKALGFTIPASLLARADELIE